MPSPIPVYYHDGFYNFRSPVQTIGNLVRYGRLHKPVYNIGDQISPVIVAGLAGRPAKYAGPYRKNKLIAIGSVLAGVQPGDTIWGSGLMKPEHVVHVKKYAGRFEVRAVRGPETCRVLRENGLDCPEIFGDPALLMPLVHPRQRSREFRMSIIPHISQIPYFKGLELPAKVRLISPTEKWQDFIGKICESELVVSSSLHGVILADAYGVPAVPMVHGSFLHGTSFKFLDYFKSTHRSDVAFVDSERAIDIAHIEAAYERMGPPRIDLLPLLRAFPHLDGGARFQEKLAALQADDGQMPGLPDAEGGKRTGDHGRAATA